MATQLKVHMEISRSKRLDPPLKRRESPLIHISRDSDSKKTAMPMKSPKVWLDRFWREKPQELLLISSNRKKWQAEHYYLQALLVQERQL